MSESLLSTAALPSTLSIGSGRADPTREMSSLGVSSVGTSTLGGRQRSFAEVLSIADRAPQDAKTQVDPSRDAAERLVATTLVEPILKQLRESVHIAPPFGPGKGEQSFQSIADAHTAKEVVKSKNFALVDRLAQELRSGSASLAGEQAQEISA